MSTDDDFARDLRARLDGALPSLSVRTDRVLHRARRRRALTRSARVSGAVGAVALVAVAALGGWGGGLPWSGTAAPGGLGSSGGTATAEPAPAGTPTELPTVLPTATAAPDAAGYPADGTIADAEGHPYWYVRAEGVDGGSTETWYSLDRPGLIVTDGDLSTASGIGPASVIGSFVIDGVRDEQLDDATALPTDPEALRAVLYASVQPDVRSGTDDDKVFGMIADLLTYNPGLLPADLRAAAWQVATGLPGATVTAGTDDEGRSGQVLRYGTGDDWRELVLDPATSLVLQQSGEGVRTVYRTQGPADSVPVQPTLEGSGCTSWTTC